MKWTRVSDTLEEAAGGYSVERRAGYWCGYVPERSMPIYSSRWQTFSDNSSAIRDAAKRAVEEYALPPKKPIRG